MGNSPSHFISGSSSSFLFIHGIAKYDSIFSRLNLPAGCDIMMKSSTKREEEAEGFFNVEKEAEERH